MLGSNLSGVEKSFICFMVEKWKIHNAILEIMFVNLELETHLELTRLMNGAQQTRQASIPTETLFPCRFSQL